MYPRRGKVEPYFFHGSTLPENVNQYVTYRSHFKREVLKKYMILDRDQKIIRQLRGICEAYQQFYYVEVFFNNDDQILNQFLKYTPDLVCMDMDDTLKDIYGFLLNVLLYLPEMPYIIGMSSCKKKAYDVYQYELSGFLWKPLHEVAIRKSMLKYLKKVER